MWFWLALGATVVAIPFVLIGCNTYLRYQGWTVERLDPDVLSNKLRPAYRVRMPAGDGPWPTALLFSGCDGPKDNLDRLSAALNADGWGTVIVDSHGPRGYDEAQLWRLVCAGQMLTGGERAGDIAVAIEDARAMPQVDSDRIVLFGSSHGGWSILDLISLRGQGRVPYNLTRWPESIATQGLEGVVGTVLFYPYCGAGSQVLRHGWAEDIPALFLLVKDDTIADEASCLKVARRMLDRGRDVEIHVLEGTTHGFDQYEKSLFSTLEFSPTATEEAQSIVRRFLDRVEPR